MIFRFIIAFWVLLQVSVAGPSQQMLLAQKTASSSLSVSGAWKNAAVGTGSVTVTVSPTAGRLLVIGISEYPSAANNASVSDNVGGTSGWTSVGYATQGAQLTAGMFYKANIPSGITSITITASTSATDITAIVHEVTGASTSSPFTSGESGTFTSASTSNPTVSVTTATANSVLFAHCFNNDGANPSQMTVNSTGSAGGTWALYSASSAELDGVTYNTASCPSLVVSSSGSKTHGWTFSAAKRASAIAAAFH